jgi:dipeptidyl aminopeptidase/acylaminoacyl peptidase
MSRIILSTALALTITMGGTTASGSEVAAAPRDSGSEPSMAAGTRAVTPCARSYSCWGATPAADPNALRFNFTASPDGTRLAFVSGQSGNFEIYLMRPGEGHTRNVTNHPGSDTDPAFSPDGRWLAFVSNREGGPALYAMAADGSAGPLRISGPGSADATPSHPVFSPDGVMVAYTVTRGGDTAVFAAAADGSTPPVQVSGGIADAFGPTFSPDGRRVTFHAGTGEGVRSYVTAVDGSDDPRLVQEMVRPPTTASR